MQAKEVAVTYWATVEVDYIPYEQVWYVALVVDMAWKDNQEVHHKVSDEQRNIHYWLVESVLIVVWYCYVKYGRKMENIYISKMATGLEVRKYRLIYIMKVCNENYHKIL
jgi:hypothetical protein